MPSANVSTSPSTEYADASPGAGELPRYPRGLYVPVAGDVTVTGLDDVQVTFTAVPAGSVLPIGCKVLAAAPAGTVLLF